MSMPDPSSDSQFGPCLVSNLAPTPTSTHSAESGPRPSGNSFEWDLPQFGDGMGIDGVILGAESELGHPCLLETWASQTDPVGSQAMDHILNLSPLSPPRESQNGSGTMTISSGPGIPDHGSSNRVTPGASPLHTAAKRGQAKIVRLLLEHKARCDSRDDGGLTPLIHATMGGYEEVAALLLSHGASIGLTDRQHRSALHWAVINRLDRLLKLLLKNCVGDRSIIDGLTAEGQTPLQLAVETDFEAAVELLLESGADAQYKDRMSD